MTMARFISSDGALARMGLRRQPDSGVQSLQKTHRHCRNPDTGDRPFPKAVREPLRMTDSYRQIFAEHCRPVSVCQGVSPPWWPYLLWGLKFLAPKTIVTLGGFSAPCVVHYCKAPCARNPAPSRLRTFIDSAGQQRHIWLVAAHVWLATFMTMSANTCPLKSDVHKWGWRERVG